jgi:carboxypeptidase PM20D1
MVIYKCGRTPRSSLMKFEMNANLTAAACAMIAGIAGLGTPAAAFAKNLDVHAQAEAQTLELAKEAIKLRSVRGPGNETPKVAALFRRALLDAGFDDDKITVVPVDDTAYLIARWPGADPTLKPLVISGHMDVVEANPSDWQRNPFVPVVESGFLFGRGATDMKFDAALAIASLGELTRQGYKPRRTIIIEFSGDEETAMKTSELIADQLSNAEMVINIDGGGVTLDEKTGKPKYFTLTGAEKTYADFEMAVTNPGGHSSQPHKINAITQLANALIRIGNYQFKPELNEITRAWFASAAAFEEPKTASAMRAFVSDPTNKEAIATLTASPEMIGKIGTTCVATMANAGHARNALPQRATANVNCRIFPGHKPEDIMAELEKVVNDQSVSFTFIKEGSVPADASPLRGDIISAIQRSIHEIYPNLPIFPNQASGGTDCVFSRRLNVPCYTVSPVSNKSSDEFSHGLNERVPIMNIRPGINYYLSLFQMLSK